MARKTVIQMWQEANARIDVISPQQAARNLEKDDVLLLDVREEIELRGHETIKGARHVPRGVLEWWACPESPTYREGGPFGDFDKPIITFCTGGGNGAFTAVALQQLGYTNVATIEGGYLGWLKAGLPTVPTVYPTLK